MNCRIPWLLAIAFVIVALLGFLMTRRQTEQTGPASANESLALSDVCDCFLVYDSVEGNQVKTYALDLKTRQRQPLSLNGENRLAVFPSPDNRRFVSIALGTRLLLWSSSFDPITLFTASAGEYIFNSRWSTDATTIIMSIGLGSDAEIARSSPQRVVAVDVDTGVPKTLFTTEALQAATQEKLWGVLGVAKQASALILSTGTRDTSLSFWKWSDATSSFHPVNADIDWSIYLAVDPKNEQLVWLDDTGLKKLTISTLALSSVQLNTQSDSPISVPNNDGRVMVISSADQGGSPVLKGLDLQTDSLAPLGTKVPPGPSGLAGAVWTPDSQALLDYDIVTKQFFLLRLSGKSDVMKGNILGNSPMIWMMLPKVP